MMNLRVADIILVPFSFCSQSFQKVFLLGLLLLFIFPVFSQDTISNNKAQDSINKAYLQQVKQNTAANGGDTTRFNAAPADTVVSGLAGDTADAARDSIIQAKKSIRHSPKKAALLSLVPGLGQAYNHRYWKIPIIYAGFGGLGYAIYYTATNFYGYRKAYRAQVADPPDQTASYKGVSKPATLKSYRDYFKNNLDISVIVTVVWYALNIIDATVDAHLFEWNMKDDLSVSWRPTLINTSGIYNSASARAGVNITLTF